MSKVEKTLKIISFISIILAVVFFTLDRILESYLGGSSININAKNSQYNFAVAKAAEDSIPVEVTKFQYYLSTVVSYAMIATLVLALFSGIYLLIRYVCVPEFARYKKYFENMFRMN